MAVWLALLLTGLEVEPVEQNTQRLLTYLRTTYWRLMDRAGRDRWADALERTLWAGVTAGTAPTIQAAYFGAWRRLSTSPAAVGRMRRIWAGEEEVPGVPLAEPDFIALAEDLAVRAEHAGRASGPRVVVVGFDYPASPTEVWRSGDVRVLAGQVRHEPVHPAVGYRVETPDGVVVVSGDTLVCDEMAELSVRADVLVYEAMRFSEILPLPAHRRFIADYHADTVEIGRQAADLRVPTLVLTHLIPPPTSDEDEAAFVADVRSGGYEGEVVVARDLTAVTVG